MAANFYSMRNMLEANAIRDNDRNNQFLAAVLTSYPCLDIWVRVADDNDLEVRVLYIQKNQDYTATESWQRDTEEAKVWKQKRGEWPEILGWFIGVLPSLSRLHAEKRNGLANFGQANPYDGGGLVTNVNDDGTINVLGRFGVLTVTIDGVEVPFSAYDWDFDGCEVEITITPDGSWNEATFDDRPVQNTGGRNRQVINRTGSFEYTMQGGLLQAVAPSWAQPPFGFATTCAEWPGGVAVSVPLGTATAITDPTPFPGFSYGSTLYPSFMGQAYVSLSGSCNDLQQISADTYEGTLVVAPPRYAFSSGQCTMVNNGVTSASASVQYAAGGAGSNETPGTVTIVKSGGPGAYTYSVSWAPDDVGSPVSASFQTPVVSTDTGFDCYRSAVTPGNFMAQALLASQSAFGVGAVQYNSMNVDCDTEGILSTPPPLADYPTYSPPADTANLDALSWRHQLNCALP